ncbi:hypothetical protein V1477_014126 [Vespula maculifrons]|uniref:Uncharacterized protein n=1 Tax=Vespula maculifrons TaxID=7453 RepID=A0ABD2BLC1_VESMC
MFKNKVRPISPLLGIRLPSATYAAIAAPSPGNKAFPKSFADKATCCCFGFIGPTKPSFPLSSELDPFLVSALLFSIVFSTHSKLSSESLAELLSETFLFFLPYSSIRVGDLPQTLSTPHKPICSRSRLRASITGKVTSDLKL